MPEQRRRFSAQFRAEAVQMVLETGNPIAEVARDLGIHDGTLCHAVRVDRRGEGNLSHRHDGLACRCGPLAGGRAEHSTSHAVEARRSPAGMRPRPPPRSTRDDLAA